MLTAPASSHCRSVLVSVVGVRPMDVNMLCFSVHMFMRVRLFDFPRVLMKMMAIIMGVCVCMGLAGMEMDVKMLLYPYEPDSNNH